ncbi:Xaa-Pro dipeptidase [Silvibacterium bohemicum]|uniref:Xaa-Pro dipeptidase n=1 Tax=Silvibacterium bohemicum TaxID=1577686 RepID=A0A841JXT9_9BACT|nr:Xaa-Pro peptidase family protein [Silvibacterium bohemicum]MBB6146162.1 Xaa-Pro dipeptidase [Silvibacterium bohemicum]
MTTTRRSFLAGAAPAALIPALSGRLHAQEATGTAANSLPPAIAALKDRRSEAKPITSAEREERIARARELMEKNGMAAICLAGGATLNYFCGVRWGNSERLTVVVIPVKGQPYGVCPAFEEERLQERLALVPAMAQTRLYTWQEDESPYERVAHGLKDLGLTSGTVGIEETMPYVFAEGIGRALPQAKLVNARPVTVGCRSIKSSAELALMQFANSVTLQVYEAAWRSGHPGMSTHDFSALIGSAYERVGFPGDASCETGEYSALPHGSIKPQTIREGAIVLIDDGCTVEGYQSDISRTFVYGKPSDKMRQVFDIVHRAQARALATARPGVPCEAVDAAARKVITDAGYGPDYAHFTHRVGHGIGMDGHEWPYLVRGNTLPLAANMTFSDEPGIYIRGEFGIRLEDDMYITEDGAKLFTGPSLSLEEPFTQG